MIRKINRKTRRQRFFHKGKGIDLYTIIYYDPDAPSLYLHWLVVNIPGEPNANKNTLHEGNTLKPYTPPAHPGVPHNYHLTIYKQSSVINHTKSVYRAGFDLTSFVKDYRLQKVSDKVTII